MQNAVYVSGAVSRPGRVRLSSARERLLDILTLAGGSPLDINELQVKVVRGNREVSAPLNEISVTDAANLRLHAGDRVILDRVRRTFTVFGATDRINQIPFESRTLNRTLAALPTRDAVLPIICALAMSRESGLRALLDDLPPSVTYSDRIQQFPQESSSALMSWMLAGEEHERNARLSDTFAGIAGAPLGGIDLTDGVRMEFSNARVIHLRPSGNAPELRCYTEAENEACAARLNRMTLDWIKAR